MRLTGGGDREDEAIPSSACVSSGEDTRRAVWFGAYGLDGW